MRRKTSSRRNQINIGDEFGRLIVINYSHYEKGERFMTCECECGKLVKIRSSSLRRGQTKSCGCYKSEQISKANSARTKLT